MCLSSNFTLHFRNLDKNSDSIIEVDELKPLLIQIGFGDLDDEGIQKIIDIFDENGDGEMDFLEFIEFFSYVCKNLVKKNPKAKYLKYANVLTKNYDSTSSFSPQNHIF